MTEEHWRPTVAEINLSEIGYNVGEMRRFVDKETHIMAVVKADAYGHGMIPVAKTALAAGADWLGVAIAEEGVKLRLEGIMAPVLVMGASEPAAMLEMVKESISVTLFSVEGLEALQRAADMTGMRAKAHLKLDTGMHRLGVKEEQELKKILTLWRSCDGVELEGVFSHFAAADTEDLSYAHMQNRRFVDMLKVVQAAGFSPLTHICNTAAAITMPEAHYDMVRLGIGLYGYAPSPGVGDMARFMPAMTVRSALSRAFDIEKGDAVGYGCCFVAARPMRVGTIPIGYGDGYRRMFTDRARVLIRGKSLPVLGRICMDQCMVDITELPDAGVGEEVVLLGRQGAEEITAEEWAHWADSISYEMMLGLTRRVPRVYTESDVRR